MSYSLKKATAWNVAAYLYLLLASFLTTPSLIRALGVEQFGRYAIALGLSSLITSVDLGLSRATVYYLIQAKTTNDKNIILSTSFTLFVVLALLSSWVAYLVFSLSLAIFVGVTVIMSQLLTLPESRGDFARVNLRSLLVGSANTFVAVWIASQGWGVDGVLYGLSIATLLVIILSPIPLIAAPSLPDAKKMLHYGLGNQLGKIVGQLQSQYAKFIMSANPLYLTSYTVGSSLVGKGIGGITQASAALFPQAANGKSDKLAKGYHQAQLLLFALGLVAIIMYQWVGQQFIYWWLDNQVIAGYVHQFLSIFRFYAMFLLLTPLASTVVDGAGKPWVTSVFGLTALVIEITVTILLYPAYGLLAPAYGGLFSLSLMVPIFLAVTEKILLSGDTLAPTKRV